MSNKSQALLNAALLLLKGAVIEVLGLANARTVNKLKIGKNGKGGIIFGGLKEAPNDIAQEEIKNEIIAKIAENVEFHVLIANREKAESCYGDIVLDQCGVPSSLTKLRLVYVSEFVVGCSAGAVVDRAGAIQDVEFTKFEYDAEKRQLEVAIAVKGNSDDLRLAEDVETDMLPPVYRIISSSSVEGRSGGGPETDKETDVEVTPWSVNAASDSGVDYDKLVVRFGCSKIDEALLERFERVTGAKPHRFLRRGLFFAHRDLDMILDAKEQGKPVYLYTGRGPTSMALHLGHLIPFQFCRWLMDVLECPIVIQLTDDEKFLFKENLTLEECQMLAIENTKDILACGFDVSRTFIFRDTDYIKELYPTILKFQKKTTFNQARGIFGFDDSSNIGKIAFPAVQAVPSFSCVFPGIFGDCEKVKCLIPCAIDQDPYFRMTRDVAPRLGLLKPCEVLSKFIPALQGAKTKMSGSDASSMIDVLDEPKAVKEKIMKYAFSGGGATQEEHRLKGANLEVDIPYQYLRFFLEDDDELKKIADDYGSGRMLTGEIKEKLSQVICETIALHKALRAQVTDEVVKQVMNPDRPELRAKFASTKK